MDGPARRAGASTTVGLPLAGLVGAQDLAAIPPPSKRRSASSQTGYRTGDEPEGLPRCRQLGTPTRVVEICRPLLQGHDLSTGEVVIVEYTEKDKHGGDGGDGTGKNRLGQILMRVREGLRSQ